MREIPTPGVELRHSFDTRIINLGCDVTSPTVIRPVPLIMYSGNELTNFAPRQIHEPSNGGIL
jgi:hypothetical protein